MIFSIADYLKIFSVIITSCESWSGRMSRDKITCVLTERTQNKENSAQKQLKKYQQILLGPADLFWGSALLEGEI